MTAKKFDITNAEQIKQTWDDQHSHWAAPEQVAETVYEAATDGKDQLRYFAGKDAEMLYAQRLQLGDEAFRKQVFNVFFKG